MRTRLWNAWIRWVFNFQKEIRKGCSLVWTALLNFFKKNQTLDKQMIKTKSVRIFGNTRISEFPISQHWDKTENQHINYYIKFQLTSQNQTPQFLFFVPCITKKNE